MISIKIPGGIVSAEQLEALGKVAREFAPLRKGHIATRENVEFHHLKLEGAEEAIVSSARWDSHHARRAGILFRNVITNPSAGAYADFRSREARDPQAPRRGRSRPARGRESFVVSEDDYIGYLAQSELANVLPVTLAAKLRRSHLLFVAYPVVEWSLRVFLHRVFGRPADQLPLVGGAAGRAADPARVLAAARRRSLRRPPRRLRGRPRRRLDAVATP